MVRQSARIIAIAAMAVAGAAIAGAAPAQPRPATPTPSCLWRALTPMEQLRLELSARTGAGVSGADIASMGAERVSELLAICGFAPERESVVFLAAFWAAKASAADLRAQISALGIDLDAADAALAKAAPMIRRHSFAREIRTHQNAAAAAGLRAAVREMQIHTPMTAAAARKLAEYYVAVILADGLPSPM